MCGGKGKRMNLPYRGAREKPLVPVSGKKLIDYSLTALKEVKLDVLALTSPNSPETENYLKEKGISVIRAPGKGYVEDMIWFIEKFRFSFPLLVVSADLIFIKNEIFRILDFYYRCDKPAITAVKNSENVGINVVDGYYTLFTEFQPEEKCKVKWVVNVNSRKDVECAENILKKFKS